MKNDKITLPLFNIYRKEGRIEFTNKFINEFIDEQINLVEPRHNIINYVYKGISRRSNELYIQTANSFIPCNPNDFEHVYEKINTKYLIPGHISNNTRNDLNRYACFGIYDPDKDVPYLIGILYKTGKGKFTAESIIEPSSYVLSDISNVMTTKKAYTMLLTVFTKIIKSVSYGKCIIQPMDIDDRITEVLPPYHPTCFIDKHNSIQKYPYIKDMIHNINKDNELRNNVFIDYDYIRSLDDINSKPKICFNGVYEKEVSIEKHNKDIVIPITIYYNVYIIYDIRKNKLDISSITIRLQVKSLSVSNNVTLLDEDCSNPYSTLAISDNIIDDLYCAAISDEKISGEVISKYTNIDDFIENIIYEYDEYINLDDNNEEDCIHKEHRYDNKHKHIFANINKLVNNEPEYKFPIKEKTKQTTEKETEKEKTAKSLS